MKAPPFEDRLTAVMFVAFFLSFPLGLLGVVLDNAWVAFTPLFVTLALLLGLVGIAANDFLRHPAEPKRSTETDPR